MNKKVCAFGTERNGYIMDIFEEYMFAGKRTPKDYVIIGLIIAAAVLVSCVLFILPVIIAQATGFAFSFTLPFVLTALAWYGAYRLMQHRYVEFEYTLANSEMDIDKIIAKRSRKRLISVDFKEAEIVAAVDDSEHNSAYGNTDFTVYDASGHYADGVYFADFSSDGKKIRLLFRPTEKIMEDIRKFNPRNVFIK